MVRRYALGCAYLICGVLLSAAALAQNAPAILPAGDAAVAGFSGTVVIGSPPEARRLDKTFINLDGPALRVIDLTRMGGPPQAQLVNAAKLFTATAGQIGQVFALALDDANPPNIYAAASSAYGLPIVVPDADGDGVPDRARRGAPNAAFMPGLFGPVQLNGGPGSIWKIDGQTGAVTLFANVVLAGVPNSGPALGGMAFDRASRQLFVADRDTGMIHRFTLDGVERGVFDHGTQALSGAGLPPIAFDPRKRLNIESPAFDTGNPGTWSYAPAARRVFGMAVGGGRLYYAVAAGLRIWSVSLLPDGSFGPDARFEVAVPRSVQQSAEVSEILFDDNGDMLVAERGAPTGTYDYKALAESPENRVLRFRPKTPDDPPSRDLWFPVPKEYAVGFPPTLRNDNGGIAIGYGYDQAGNINSAVCGGMLWSTGEQLRNARDRSIIQRLQAGGPLIVDGLQGNSTRLLRPLNEPPFETYFIDYDDRFDDPQTRGYMGDVVIWRVCGQAALPVVPLLPVVAMCPPGLFDIDGICQAGLLCPQGTEFSNGCCVHRDCPSSYVRVNGKCVPPPIRCKLDETYANGRCEAPRCPAGMQFVKSPAGGGSGPNGLNASNSGLSSGALNELEKAVQGRDKPKMCNGGGYCKCPDGTQVSEDGTCKKTTCPVQTIEINGVCCTREDLTRGKCHWRPQPPPPKLTIRKDAPKSCQLVTTGSVVNTLGGPFYLCKFVITVTNNGTTPASGATFTDTATPPARIVDIGALDSNGQPDVNSTAWQCNDPTNAPLTCKRQAGNDIPAGGSVQFVVATATLVAANTGTIGNCAAVGDTPALNQGQPTTLNPGNNISLTSPAGQQLVNAAEGGKKADCASVLIAPPPIPPPIPPPPPPPPTTTTDCPLGTKRGFNGQCFFVDPGCQGPNCGQVTTGCPNGADRKSDGTCCNARDYQVGACHVPPQTGSQPTCQPPKFVLLGKCVCRPGTEGDDCHVPTKQTCQFPKLLRGGQCVCRGGTVGDDCHVPTKDKTKTKDKTCRQGTHLVDGECVRGFSNQQKNKPSGNKKEKAGPGINPNSGLTGFGNRSTGSGKSGGGSGGSKGKGN